jgi:RNA polymerase sigma-70 factor (ECF subfamily)
MEETDSELIKAVLNGNVESFEILVKRYQPRVFATARRYARLDSEVEDIVQDVFIKAFQKLATFRGESPFEHWLMRLTVRTCYDHLRVHQRNREHAVSELTEEETSFIERHAHTPVENDHHAEAARELLEKVLSQISPSARLVIQLLEIEDKSMKEISALTGWSVPVVKIRAFRARAELKKVLARVAREKYL